MFDLHLRGAHRDIINVKRDNRGQSRNSAERRVRIADKLAAREGGACNDTPGCKDFGANNSLSVRFPFAFRWFSVRFSFAFRWLSFRFHFAFNSLSVGGCFIMVINENQ